MGYSELIKKTSARVHYTKRPPASLGVKEVSGNLSDAYLIPTLLYLCPCRAGTIPGLSRSLRLSVNIRNPTHCKSLEDTKTDVVVTVGRIVVITICRTAIVTVVVPTTAPFNTVTAFQDCPSGIMNRKSYPFSI